MRTPSVSRLETILEFLLKNNAAAKNGGSLYIGATRWCKGAGTGGTDRMAVRMMFLLDTTSMSAPPSNSVVVGDGLGIELRSYAESSATPAQAAGTGALVGVVKSAALGDSSVSYDTDALTRATADWGDLNATQYGQILASRARLVGMGGTYCLTRQIMASLQNWGKSSQNISGV